ncbi:MAG: hypothetical protein GXY34_04325 [Syntrophomonadaceae bacterium]|nr:hypothetical protein [Syntrophomonadaceae bacterium]
MEELLSEAQSALFQYDIIRASKYLAEIFDLLDQLQEMLDITQQAQLQEALQQLDRSLQNNDYLLTADLLEYAIQPLINRAYQ